MDRPAALGKTIHTLRSRRNLTRQQLIELAQQVDTGFSEGGLSTSSLSRLEKEGRSPRLHELVAICEVVGVTLVELFEEFESFVREPTARPLPPRRLPLAAGDLRLADRARRLLAELDVDLDAETAQLHVHFHLPPDEE